MIDVVKVSKLAKLSVKEPMLSAFKKQIEDILEFVSKLHKAKTENVIPTSQVTGLVNVMREDEIDVSRMLTQEQVLSNAPDSYNGFFKVPFIWT